MARPVTPPPESAEAFPAGVELERRDSPDYLEQNHRAWNAWAAGSIADARKAWATSDLEWGLWKTPESSLHLLEPVAPGSDIVELGSGAASVSAGLARQGMYPVAVDFCQAQLDTGEQLQREHALSFPLVLANAEAVPYDHSSFDVVISEYGASVWCDPRRWLPEAHRLLRPGGFLMFFTNSAMLMACTSLETGRAGRELVRDYFGSYRVEFNDGQSVEFHPTHGGWVRLLRASGFAIENLIEVRPHPRSKPRYEFVPTDWARRWPSEEIWVARKTATPGGGGDRPADATAR